MLEMVSPGYYRLHGVLSMQNCSELLNELFTLIDDKKTTLSQLQLDVSGLEKADSVLLAAILHIARAIESREGVLRIIGVSESMRGLARAYGVDVLIEHYMVHG